jgi:sigma-E factor negative regulatory protein RseC
MIEEAGQVVSCEGEFAWVETERKSSCSSCAANKGCGTGVVSKFYNGRFSRVKALNPIHAAPGDMIVLGLAEEALVRGSLAIYGLPLLTLLLMALLGNAVANEAGMQEADGLIALFGMAGLLLGFYLVRMFSRKIARDDRYQPVILRHCNESYSETLVDIQR